MYWKFPKLLHLIEYRTIENIQPVYFNGHCEQYQEYSENNKVLIGYVIESTTGLLTDCTFCIFRFSENWLKNKTMIKLLKQYKNRVCIIDQYSASWGKKKIVLGKKILNTCVSKFSENNNLEKPIIIKKYSDLRIKLNLTIQ